MVEIVYLSTRHLPVACNWFDLHTAPIPKPQEAVISSEGAPGSGTAGAGAAHHLDFTLG